jgi:hypothetical protein
MIPQAKTQKEGKNSIMKNLSIVNKSFLLIKTDG